MHIALGRLALLAALALTSPATAGETIHVTVEKMMFTPAKISAHVGDTVEWTNKDFVVHTATARNKDFDVTIPVKGTGRVTLKQAGDVAYFCRFHPNMTGEIAVAP